MADGWRTPRETSSPATRVAPGRRVAAARHAYRRLRSRAAHAPRMRRPSAPSSPRTGRPQTRVPCRRASRSVKPSTSCPDASRASATTAAWPPAPMMMTGALTVRSTRRRAKSRAARRPSTSQYAIGDTPWPGRLHVSDVGDEYLALDGWRVRPRGCAGRPARLPQFLRRPAPCGRRRARLRCCGCRRSCAAVRRARATRRGRAPAGRDRA